jgi:hypothetical protein
MTQRIVRWACEAGYPAEAAVHVGLGGVDDEVVFAHAFHRDQVVVTVNVGDFIRLAAATELHPGVIRVLEVQDNGRMVLHVIPAA